MRRLLVLLIGLVSLGGCDAGGGDEVEIAIVEGAGQQGLAGRDLPEVIVLEVRRGGRPAAGVQVRASASDGGRPVGETVRTGSSGRAAVAWRLGTEGERQRLTLTAEGGRAEVEATLLPPDQADVVVVRGTDRVRGVVVLADDGGRRTVVRERTTSDTEIPLRPLDGGTATVVVFGTDAPPAVRTVAWTPGPDRVEVTLPPPVAIDVRIDMLRAPFEEYRDAALRDVARMDAIWRASGLGLRVGRVDVVDRSDIGPTVASIGSCDVGGLDGSTFLVRYVYDIPGYQGYACGNGLAFMAAHTGERGILLAHEFGHLFGLQHAASGVMWQTAQGNPTFADGEILRAHLYTQSDLNRYLAGTVSEAEHRTCSLGVDPQPCLDARYALP